VYWEQRGAGRSYHSDIPRSSMTIERMVRDLDEFVDSVRSRFGKDRVVLLGHSWGTILGTLYATRDPGKVSVYVGVAQIANFREGERASLAWALRQAEARRDRGALEVLRAMKPAPRSVSDELTLGRWVERFGGLRRGGLTTGKLIWAALRTDEAGLLDLVKFGKGNRFSLEALRPQYSRVDLTRLQCFEVPVIFMLGRHDWHVPAVLAARYFATIDAPSKRLVWFDSSAHDPPFEEPGAFVRTMLAHVRPLALEVGDVRSVDRCAADEELRGRLPLATPPAAPRSAPR
jgi:proline iminopeptidase